MLELFIDNKKVDIQGEDLEAKVTYQFLDTYQPEALIGAHSKTITLPDTVTNNTIFANFQERYSALILQDGSRTVLSGYATLDKVTSNGLSDKYELTLYDNMGEFFSNLKGSDREPRGLEDLYYRLTGFNQVTENTAVIVNLDELYAHNSWIPSGSQTDPVLSSVSAESTFTVVPCNLPNDKGFDREKLLFNETTQALRFFKSGSDDGSGSYFTSGSAKYVMVNMEENTPYAMMNVPINNMPLGIRYRRVIEACCNPVNNGGYTVNLDPDWFNHDNPYWTELFILNKNKGQDIDYGQVTSEGDYFTYPTVNGVGNYQISASNNMEPWTRLSNGTLTTTNLVNQTKFEFKCRPEFVLNPSGSVNVRFNTEDAYGINGTINVNWTLGQQISGTYYPGEGFNPVPFTGSLGYPDMKLTGTYRVRVKIVNTSNNQTVAGDWATIPEGTTYRSLNNTSRYIPVSNDIGNLTCSVVAPGDMFPQGSIGIKVMLEVAQSNLKFCLFNNIPLGNAYDGENHVTYTVCVKGWYNARLSYQNNITGNWPVYYGAPTPQPTHLTTTYNSATLEALAPLSFTKKELLGGLGTPLEWFVKYLRMFNLRIYCHKTTKQLDILTVDNYIRKFAPLDLTGKIDYGRDMVKTRSVIDESYINWAIEPNKNESTERYNQSNGDSLFDRTIRIKQYGTDDYNYLNTDIKVGSTAQKKTPFLAREKVYTNPFTFGISVEGIWLNAGESCKKILFGINQRDSVDATYYNSTDGQYYSSPYRIEYVNQSSLYTVLELEDDVAGTLVMRNGDKIIMESDCHTVGQTCADVKVPFLFYRPSSGMILAAGKACYLGGMVDKGNHSDTWQNYGTMYGCPFGTQLLYPVFGNVSGGKALSYKPEDFESIQNPNDIYTQCFQDFIEKTYLKPEVVECYVFLDEPELRRLYWFDNRYWILSKIEDYDADSTDPVKCTFIRYRTTDDYSSNPTPGPTPGGTLTSVIGDENAIIGTSFMVGSYQ